MIKVTVSPSRISADAISDLEIRLANGGQGMCTNIIFTIRLPAGIMRVSGKERLEVSELAPGQSIASPLRVLADRQGHYQLTSPNFSYRDHQGQVHRNDGFITKIIVEPKQPLQAVAMDGEIADNRQETAVEFPMLWQGEHSVPPRYQASLHDPAISANRPGGSHLGRVFLCYSSSDKSNVRALRKRLLDDKIQPWLDEEDILPGQDWDLAIRKAIRVSDVVLVCLSKASVSKAGYLQKEIKHILDVADEQPEGTIFLVPIRLEPCDVPERLRRWQWVDLFEDGGYSRLLRALRSCNSD